MTTKPRTRKNAAQTKSLLMRRPAISAIILAGLAAAVLLYFGRPQGAGTAVQFRHIHGLGFSSDGRQLLVPAHDGLLIFEAGGWMASDLPVHDYMGFSPTDNGFYSSGHPGPGSNLVNPLGLVSSSDGGRTLNTLAFEGESDFHVMAVGYENHAVYVLNPAQNSQLSVGLHYTLDDGQTWEQSRAQGISGTPIQLAVHPTEANVVALAAEGGLFLSNDYGSTFTRVSRDAPVTSASFDLDGSRLFFGYQSLSVYDLDTGGIETLPTPTIASNDAVGFIAANPVSDEIAFATYNKDIYFSVDNGQSWEQIAQQGVGES